MLETSDGRNSLGRHRPRPFERGQIKHEQVVEPVLAVASTKHKHHVLDNTRSVELSHGSFAPDDRRNVKCEFLDSFLEVDEDDVGKDLAAVPAAVDDDLRAVPKLARVPHAWLRQFVLVYFRLEPQVFLWSATLRG